MCSLPSVLSQCLQDDVLASTQGGFFFFLAQSQSRSKDRRKVLATLAEYTLGPFGTPSFEAE